MADAPIPHFPVVHGNVYPDGTAHINFAGHDLPLTPANIDDARAQITSYAIAVARDVLHRPVRLTTVDPDGQWILAAHPDGRITDLAPAARPAKRPKRRRAAPSTPAPTPVTNQALTAPAPIGNPTETVRTRVPSASVPAPTAPAPDALTRVSDGPTWTVTDLPSEAEVTVFIERLRAPAAQIPVLELRFSNGSIVTITGAALVGRRPVNNTDAQLDVHQVDDDTRNLSRTHFAIAWSDEVPAIIDQHSGNGTKIQRRGIDLAAAPHVATPLRDGDILHFGDLSCQVTLSVTREVTPR